MVAGFKKVFEQNKTTPNDFDPLSKSSFNPFRTEAVELVATPLVTTSSIQLFGKIIISLQLVSQP